MTVHQVIAAPFGTIRQDSGVTQSSFLDAERDVPRKLLLGFNPDVLLPQVALNFDHG